MSGLFHAEPSPGRDGRSTIILLTAPILVNLWKYGGSRAFFLTHGPLWIALDDPEWAAAAYTCLTGLLLFGLIPIVIVKGVFRDPLSHYGLQVGDWQRGARALAVMVPVLIGVAFLAAKNPQLRAEYPWYRGAGGSLAIFARYACLYGTYYAGYEILLRGFVQFGLGPQIGSWNAILVQTAISSLFHIGTPPAESFSAILAGLLWGIVAFRSRSLLYGLVAHWVLGVSLDFFLCFTP